VVVINADKVIMSRDKTRTGAPTATGLSRWNLVRSYGEFRTQAADAVRHTTSTLPHGPRPCPDLQVKVRRSDRPHAAQSPKPLTIR
jgi:hypothetical protein